MLELICWAYCPCSLDLHPYWPKIGRDIKMSTLGYNGGDRDLSNVIDCVILRLSGCLFVLLVCFHLKLFAIEWLLLRNCSYAHFY
jgi:hypothetical protein